MIPRYSRPEMMGIFDARNKLRIWLDVELAVAEEMAALDLVPKDAIAALGRNIAGARERLIDPDRVDAIETVTRHDVIAFLTHVEEVCGPEARFLHLGMTSSDLLDTTLALHRHATRDERLVFHPEDIRRKLALTQGLHASPRVLLALTESGLPRQEAYALVQRNAMLAFSERRPFLDFLKQDAEVTSRLAPGRLESLFDLGYHTRHVDLIFARVFGEGALA
jgi:adenylosuccinate lyase